MQPHLISHTTCPFVQRAVLMLKEKQVPHQTTYVDPASPPDWLPKVAFGPQLPVLELGEQLIFDGQAICEYLEEAYPSPALLPVDLFERAAARAWSRYAEQALFGGLFNLQMATDESSFQCHRQALDKALGSLEAEMDGRIWLTGDGTRFGMSDIAVAPFFTRTSLLKTWFSLDLLREHSHVGDWGERILARASVRGSVPPDFQDAMLAQIQTGAGFLSTLS